MSERGVGDMSERGGRVRVRRWSRVWGGVGRSSPEEDMSESERGLESESDELSRDVSVRSVEGHLRKRGEEKGQRGNGGRGQ